MPVISLFISSTFRDFHSERDRINGPILAALEDAVRPYGCRLEMIDLRWGVVSEDEDSELQEPTIVRHCLEAIDRASPLFVALIGDRFGWIPTVDVTSLVADHRFAGGAGLSVTAVEVEYGAIRREGQTNGPVIFHRSLSGDVPSTWRDDDPGNVRALLDRARRAGISVITYNAEAQSGQLSDDSLDRFEQSFLEQLRTRVVAHAKAVAKESTEPGRVSEALHVERSTRAVVDRDELVAKALTAVRSGVPVVLTGSEGCGKSAVLWRTATALIDDGVLGIALIVGASAHAPTEQALLRAVRDRLPDPIHPWGTAARTEAETVQAVLGVPMQDAVFSTADLRGQVLLRLEHLDTAAVMVIDELQRIQPESARRSLSLLRQIVSTVPVLTATNDRHQAELLGTFGYQVIEVGPLGEDAAASMADSVVAAWGKTLSANVRHRIASRPRSPLWVELASEVLRTLGADRLASERDAIASGLEEAVGELPDGLDELAIHVLRGWITANGRHLQAPLVELSVSRSGLTPKDLADLNGLTSIEGLRLRWALGRLVSSDLHTGRLVIAHPAIRRAALSLCDDAPAVHRRLAQLAWASRATAADDLLWHAWLAQWPEMAASALNEIDEGSPAEDEAFETLTELALADLPAAEAALDTMTSLAPSGLGLLVRWVKFALQPILDPADIASLAERLTHLASQLASRSGTQGAEQARYDASALVTEYRRAADAAPRRQSRRSGQSPLELRQQVAELESRIDEVRWRRASDPGEARIELAQLHLHTAVLHARLADRAACRAAATSMLALLRQVAPASAHGRHTMSAAELSLELDETLRSMQSAEIREEALWIALRLAATAVTADGFNRWNSELLGRSVSAAHGLDGVMRRRLFERSPGVLTLHEQAMAWRASQGLPPPG